MWLPQISRLDERHSPEPTPIGLHINPNHVRALFSRRSSLALHLHRIMGQSKIEGKPVDVPTDDDASESASLRFRARRLAKAGIWILQGLLILEELVGSFRAGQLE